MKKNAYENILERLSSKEGKEVIKKVVDELNEYQQEKKNIVSNSEYISWLENYTINHPNFTTEDWLYYPNKISDIDKEMVKKLEIFYGGIESYANKNYIYPSCFEYGVYYKIKFNNIGYKLSMVTGQGIRYFCKRVELENNDEFIDFNDIMNSKVQTNTEYIKNSLEDLSKLLNKMLDNNIPVESIVETTNKVLIKKIK